MIIELLKGLAILLSLSLLHKFVLRYCSHNLYLKNSVAGVLFGLLCIVGMLSPMEISTGVIFDARSVILSLAGIFSGWIGALISVIIAGSYRIWLGGDGAAVGVTVIISCGFLGLLYAYLSTQRKMKITFFNLLVLGAVVHLIEILIFTQLPDRIVDTVLTNISIPLFLVFTPAVPILGLLLEDNVRSLITENNLKHRDFTINQHAIYSSTDSRGIILSVNDKFCEISGYTRSELIGRSHSLLNSHEHSKEFFDNMWKTISSGAVWAEEIKNKAKDGSYYWVKSTIIPQISTDGVVLGYKSIRTDVTTFKDEHQELERSKEALHRLAYFDTLTNLPNTQSYHTFLETIYKGDIQQYLICVMGIDHMQKINATFGFSAGDEILKISAKRLKLAFFNSAFFGRLIGDNFVLVERVNESEDIQQEIQKIKCLIDNVFDAPIQTTSARVNASMTIGVIETPFLAPSADLAIIHSQMAYADAKLKARKNIYYLTKDRLNELSFTASLTHKLMDAIQGNEFFIVVQPKINVRTGIESGGEVLVRWRSQSGDMIGPDIFIPVAEDSGLIGTIGHFVFLEACSVLRSIAKNHRIKPKLAINASPHQLADETFFEKVRDVFEEQNINPSWVEFEVTETAVASFPDRVIETLTQLRAIGSTIALDDFGTGQSSLTMLQKLPIDRVKLDKAFIDNIEQNDKGFTLVENTVKMMHDMGYKVTVEGIETREMHDLLFALKVEEAQGYFYSKPIEIGKFIDYKFEL